MDEGRPRPSADAALPGEALLAGAGAGVARVERNGDVRRCVGLTLPGERDLVAEAPGTGVTALAR